MEGFPYIQVTDFGFATFHHDDLDTTTGRRLGTLRYMAPELWDYKDHNEKVDIWALGVIAFELLTGGAYFPFNLEGLTNKEQRRIVTTKTPDLHLLD